METTTAKNTTLETFVGLYDHHTRLFKNAIEGISDKDAQDRLGTKANHVAWLAGSLVHERDVLVNVLGSSLMQTSYELFKDHKGIQDGVAYPSLDEFRNDWEKITPILRDALVNASEEQLNAPDPYQMPGGNYTFFEVLPFKK